MNDEKDMTHLLPTHGTAMGLEEHFYQLAYPKGQYITGVPKVRLLYSLWNTHKEQLSLQISALSHMFDTFSDHGPKHSQAIISNINRILGDRVRYLGATDTWMLLECAYRHDAGMHVPGRDIRAFLRNDDYRALLQSLKGTADNDLRKAAMSLLSPPFPDRSQDIAGFGEEIFELRKAQDLIFQQYFRKKHGERSAQNIYDEHESKSLANVSNAFIQARLWKLIAKICLGHTQHKDLLMKDKIIPFKTDGCCDDTAHPRLVVFLLRLGDLLDLDNNRYNPYRLELWDDELPMASRAHLLKHGAIEHLLITPDTIEINAVIDAQDPWQRKFHDRIMPNDRAKYKKEVLALATRFEKLDAEALEKKLYKIGWSKDKQVAKHIQYEKEKIEYADLLNETCAILAEWFKWIEEELDHIAKNWLDIMPTALSGNVPRLRKAIISLHGRQLNKETIKLNYRISHQRAASIIQGTGLYGSTSSWGKSERYIQYNNHLVFIREFLQNAMDATHIQVFRNLLQGRFGHPSENFGKLKPNKKGNEYTNAYADWNPLFVLHRIGQHINDLYVEVRIRYFTNRDDCSLLVVFRDKGTGIDGDTLKYMKNIGQTRSPELIEEIKSMPMWLRPNGSYGIGMQSVFGVVEKFSATSASRKDHVVRDLYFSNTAFSGKIFALETTQNADQTHNYGTQIVVPMTFTQMKHAGLHPIKTADYFTFNCKMLFNEINKHIEKMTGRHLFPLRLRFYIDDVEVKSLYDENKYISVFTPLLAQLDARNANEYDKLDIHPDGSATAIFDDDGVLRVVSYQAAEQIVIDMRLQDIGGSDEKTPIGEPYGAHQVLHPIDFYYRGLKVPQIYLDNQMPYPCWDIKAYGLFGDAEEYVSIHRNQLLPDKLKEVYKLVSNAVDKSLAVLWKNALYDFNKTPARATPRPCGAPEKFLHDEIIKVVEGSRTQLNALAISFMFQYITENAKPVSENKYFYDYKAFCVKILNKTDATVAVLSYRDRRFIPDTASLKEIFQNGIDKVWMTSKKFYFEQIIERTPVIKTGIIIPATNYNVMQESELPDTVIPDFFIEYLVKRGLKTGVKSILGVKPGNRSLLQYASPPYFMPLYLVTMGGDNKQLLYDTDFKINYINYLYSYLREHSLNDSRNFDREKRRNEQLIVLPTFADYERIAITSLPDVFEQEANTYDHEYLMCFGSFVVLPITYGQLHEWIHAAPDEKTKIEENLLQEIYDATYKLATSHEKKTRAGLLAEYIYNQQLGHDANTDIEKIGVFLCDIVTDFFQTMKPKL